MSLKLGSTQVNTLVHEAFGLNVPVVISSTSCRADPAVLIDISDLCLLSEVGNNGCSHRITQQNITAMLEHAIIAIFLNIV